MSSIKKIVILSIFISIAVSLSLIDKYITTLAFPFLPTAKIGLANIIVLITIINYNFKESTSLVVSKIILASLMFGGINALIIGGTASFLSFLTMFIVYKYLHKHVSAIGISVCGGFVHIVTQLFVTAFIYQLREVVLYYGAVLVIVSLITSIIIGIVVNKLNEYYLQQIA